MARTRCFAGLCLLLCVALAAPAQEEDWDRQRFQAEMYLLEKAGDRDSAIAHLRQAVAARPNHPDNIVFEFRIGILLSQCLAPDEFKQPDFLKRRDERVAEALHVFEGILRKYRHMDYFGRDPLVLSGRYWPCDRLVLEAAIQTANCSPTKEQRRKHLWTALECLHQSWARRKKDWLSAPAPPEVKEDSPFGGEMARAKWESRFRAWQKRREMAAKGECLEGTEPDLAKVIIRMYADSLDRQDQAEVLRAMAAIVEAFPGTPMAELAQKRAEGPRDR